MHIIGRAKALLASLREDNRGVTVKLDEVRDELESIAPKIEAEFKELDESGALGKPQVTIGADKLPVPDSLYADYLRVRAELEKWLGHQAKSGEAPAPAPEPAPEAAPETPAAS